MLQCHTDAARCPCELQHMRRETRGEMRSQQRAPAALAAPPLFACESLCVVSYASAPQQSSPAYPPPACHPTFHVPRCMLHAWLARPPSGREHSCEPMRLRGRPPSEAEEEAGSALLAVGLLLAAWILSGRSAPTPAPSRRPPTRPGLPVHAQPPDLKPPMRDPQPLLCLTDAHGFEGSALKVTRAHKPAA